MTSEYPSEELLQRTIDRFWETIPPLWNCIRSNIRTIALEKFDITVEQFHILRHIRKGINSVSELATAKQISRPAISQAVDMLVSKGLVSRQQSATDRRFVRLELTASGNELLNTIFQENRGWMMEKLSTLSLSELENIIGALAALRKAFETAQECQ